MLSPRTLMTNAAGSLMGALWMAALAALAPVMAAGLALQGAGSTFSAPLYEKWIAEFERTHPSVSIHYAAIGSGEGIARFRSGAVDFGASDVPLSAADAATIERGAIQAPSAAGMIVVAYNLPGLKGQLKLPQDAYVDIFMGRIRNWDDPRIRAANPGLVLPHINIAVIGRLDASGTTYAFTSHLAAVSTQWSDEGPGVGKIVAWPHGAMLARGNEGVASRIKISDGSIGYVEFGFAHRLGLPVALLQNKDGQFVGPTEDNGVAALAASAAAGLGGLPQSLANPAGPRAYPIVTYSWLLLHQTYPAERAQALTSFVKWGLDQGQAFAADLGYLALPADVADLGKAALSGVKVADGPGD
jgi:phosphate transport system substrate-binding protein